MGIGSFYGRTATAALIGLALVVIGLRTKTALRPLAWLGAAIALGGFGLSGHVVTSGPRWLTIPTLIAHTSAAAFWAGSLLPLWQVIRSNERVAPAVVERFSRLAVVAVGVLLVAGTIIAVLQVRSPGALLTTGYGLALTVKLALVAGLIALAAWNKLRLTPALGRRKASARRAMQKTIVTEMACVFAILVATGVVGTRAPPSVLAEGAAHAAHAGGSVETGLALTIIQEKRSADIVRASAWSGVNRARIALRDADGTPVEAHEVMLIASNPGAGVEPIERIAERAEDGTGRVDDLLLAPPGRRTLRLAVLINDFEKALLETRTDLLNRQPPPASGS
jgi:copper transport protein